MRISLVTPSLGSPCCASRPVTRAENKTAAGACIKISFVLKIDCWHIGSGPPTP
jgi:hypothetical protein